MRKSNSLFKKKYMFVALVALLVVGISFGYAKLQTTLTINGTTKIPSVSWNIHFKDLTVKEGSFLDADADTGAAQNTAVIDAQDDTKLTYTVTLREPGQSYEFEVYIANDGTLNGELEAIEETGTPASEYENLPYFSYTITGLPSEGDALNASQKKKLTIKVEFPDLDDADDLPDEDFTFTKTIKLRYVQKQS